MDGLFLMIHKNIYIRYHLIITFDISLLFSWSLKWRPWLVVNHTIVGKNIFYFKYIWIDILVQRYEILNCWNENDNFMINKCVTWNSTP